MAAGVTSEQHRIEQLAGWLGATDRPPGVLVSIGDDAAVLAPGRTSMVWTVDAAVEGVHFRRDWLSFEDVGYRSLMAAASDLAAMGARPRGVLSSLVLPRDFTDAQLEELARGQRLAAEELGTAVVGGNLARGSELSVTTTVLGEADRPLPRDGAKVGDVLALAGPAGLARAGLLALLEPRKWEDAALSRAVATWRRPRARIEAGLAASPSAHAAIDLSDGLQIDALRMARASGLRIVLEEEGLARAGAPALEPAAAALRRTALELALVGGEDYAVLAAFPVGPLPPAPFVPIGTCVEGSGIAVRLIDGGTRELLGEGYDHFAG